MHPNCSVGGCWYREKIASRARVAIVSLFALLTAAPAARAGTLEQVKASGKLTLGYLTDARPFSYRDASGTPAGYAVALCARVADQVKSNLGLTTLNVEWVPVTPDARFADVQQGKIDLLCGAGAATLARSKDVSFSIAIFPAGLGALLRTDAPIGLQEVLSGRWPTRPLWRGSPAQILDQRTFSVVKGTTSERWLASRIDTFRLSATVLPVASFEDGIQAVIDRHCDVFFAERAILLDASARSPSANDLTVLDRYFTYEPLAFALARNDDDFRLVVNATLSRLFGSSEFHGLYTKWFGPPDEDALTFFRLTALPE